jgi:hypothetical protein
MRSLALLALLIVVVGTGAFLGSVVGAALGRAGNADLFVGAWIGGLAGVWGGALLATRTGLIAHDHVRGTAWGAAAGFVVTALVAMSRSSSLAGVVASILLIGVGGVVGSRFRLPERGRS